MGLIRLKSRDSTSEGPGSSWVSPLYIGQYLPLYAFSRASPTLQQEKTPFFQHPVWAQV